MPVYDIIITRKKLNIKKIIAIALLAVFLVSVCTILGIKKASDNKKAEYAKELEASQLQYLEEQRIKQEEEERQRAIVQARIDKANAPLSEEAKERVLNIYNNEDGIKRAYLTFDDGPTKAVTPFILDTLKQYNVKATFFVLGQNVKYNPDLVKREFDEGHYIANHGYTHTYSKVYSSVEATLEEFNMAQQAIRDALDNQSYNSKVFRFPGGSTGGRYSSIKKECKSYLLENDVAYLDWNALNSDAEGKFTKEQLLENAINSIGTHEDVVILMHDASDKILTNEMLPELIEYLSNNGYGFYNLYDLM